MAIITLSSLIGSVRVQSGISGSANPVDGDIITMINSSWAELYGKMVMDYGDTYFLSSSLINTTANVDSYALPDNFKIMGVDLLDGAGSITFTKLDRFSFGERDKFSRAWIQPYFNSNYFNNRGKAFQYDIQGENLKLVPTPANTAYLRVWTVPNLVYFSGTSPTVESANFKNGWNEYIVVDCALKIKDALDWDTQTLMIRKQNLDKRLQSEIGNRNSGDAFQTMTRRSRGFGGNRGGFGF